MQTLSFGFKKPEDGDKGTIFFPALEDNIQQVNDHDHNGTNSKKIPSSSVEAVTGTIVPGDWIETVAGNVWQEQVTVPAGVDLSKTEILFRISGGPNDGAQIHPYVRAFSTTAFIVEVNDPSLTLTYMYVS